MQLCQEKETLEKRVYHVDRTEPAPKRDKQSTPCSDQLAAEPAARLLRIVPLSWLLLHIVVEKEMKRFVLRGVWELQNSQVHDQALERVWGDESAPLDELCGVVESGHHIVVNQVYFDFVAEPHNVRER